MRSSPRWLAASVLALLMVLPAPSVFAENAEFDNASEDGSQIAPAGAEPYVAPTGKNLNTVPEDGESIRRVQAPENPLVKKILTSRPNEDLVICVAGCYAGQDRVVYAQPGIRLPRTTIGPQSMLHPAPLSRAN